MVIGIYKIEPSRFSGLRLMIHSNVTGALLSVAYVKEGSVTFSDPERLPEFVKIECRQQLEAEVKELLG